MIHTNVNYLEEILNGKNVNLENYFILLDIFYIKSIIKKESWRHIEFQKKIPGKTSKILDSNTALLRFSPEQYSTAASVINEIFYEKNDKKINVNYNLFH